MSSLPHLSAFLLAALLLLLTPGPAVLYVVARSVDQGRLAGFVSVLGIEAGNLVHALAATLGLSAILVSSALAFSVVKYLGAGYLVYLGLRRLLARETARRPAAFRRRRLRRVFREGLVVAVLNPKTALFFFAFLPQFVDPTRGSVAPQLLTLGCLFVLMAVATDGLYALLAGTVGRWAREARPYPWVERYVVGTVYVGLGLAAALADTGRR